MKNPIRYGVLGLIVSTAFWATPPVQGQTQPNPGRPGRASLQIQSHPQAEERPGPTVSVDFQGGPLEDYVKALQNAAGGEPVNVVVPALAKKVELPPITLRDVTIGTALSAIQSAFETSSEHQFTVNVVGAPSDATFAIVYDRVPRTMMAYGSVPGQMVMAPVKRLEVYTIRDLIDPSPGTDGSAQAKVAYESILGAVDAAMGMFDEADPPKLLFHKETGLLLVGGTAYQTELVDKLIQRIREDLRQRWSEERSTKKQSAEQARRIALARTELQIAEKDLVLGEEQLDRVKQLVDQGAASREALGQAQMSVDRARAAVERRRIELESVTEGAAGVAGAAMVLVIYDIADILPRNPEIVTLIALVAENSGGEAEVRKGSDGKPTAVAVTASERAQGSVKALLENARKYGAGSRQQR